ncbi:MAG: hypothetical protein PVI78_12310 [Anaerolineales bacterium]|jgi:hypothetical protein
MENDESKPTWMRRVMEVRWIIVVYLAVSAICMSGCCLLGYRANWILWRFGLR